MGSLSFTSIRFKMVAGFTMIALIAGVVGGLGVWKALTLNRSGNQLYEHTAVPIGELAELAMFSQQARVNIRGMLLDNDPDRAAANAESLKKRYEASEKSLAEFRKSLDSETGVAELNAIGAKMKEYRPIWEEIVRLRLSGSESEAVDLMRSKAQKIETSISKDISALIDLKIEEGKKRSQKNNVLTRSTVIQLVGFSAAGVIAAIILGFIVAARITAPLREAMEQACRIAGGDLTAEAHVLSSDETGKLSMSMNDMVRNLNTIIGAVAATSGNLDESAEKLQRVSGKMTECSSEAASHSLSLASASEEMSATAGDIAHNCIKAAQLSETVSQEASEGAGIVKSTLDRMHSIAAKVRESAHTIELLGKRSDEIGQIIATIEDIADQTNLLALNAAIEAARAGEQGRGFAVVADEVRALAERTARATRDISGMIRGIQNETAASVHTMEGSVTEVEHGIDDAERSYQALNEIIGQINDISSQVAQIATAAEEQTATTSEISKSIHLINEEIQNTAHGAEESSSESASLFRQAADLKQLVSRFRLAG